MSASSSGFSLATFSMLNMIGLLYNVIKILMQVSKE